MVARLKFVAPPTPARDAIVGRYTRLEPIDADRHARSLWLSVAGADDIWRYLAYGPFVDFAEFQGWLARRSSLADPLTFAIVDGSRGVATGLVSLMEIRPAHGVIEIGHVLFSPDLRMTRVATEAIYLAARRALDLGYRRVEWKCDARNEASKRAALRFGFPPEGIFRQHMIVKGENRDTAWFAILDHEWPALRAAIERWLAPENFDVHGKQIKRLAQCRDS